MKYDQRDKSGHFFGDFSTLTSKNKRRKVRKKVDKMRRAEEKKEVRLQNEVGQILNKAKREDSSDLGQNS